jgi:phage-related protein
VAFNLGTAAGRIIIDGSGAKSGFGVATAAANVFYDAISAKLDSVERLGDNLIKVGATGSAGLGIAVRAAANFEQGLSQVKAVSGATAEEMDLIRKAALRIGKDTSFSATEAASAMEELVKAGVSTKDVLEGAADATVALAAAGGIELPRAAEIAASAMNNFALTGKELPHIADLIAGAANASAIDVGDFGFSLSQAGATAKLAGLKFDDLAVAIAEMGQAGIKGSDAGTSIKTFLTNLIPTTNAQKQLFQELGITIVNTGADFSELAKKGIKPVSRSFADVSNAMEKYIEKTGGSKVGTKENAKAAQNLGAEMGILRNSFFDAKGDVEDFATIQEVLKKSMAGLTKEQQLSTLNTLFGSDAIRASAVFAGQGAEGFNKMADAMSKTTAAGVAATRLDNLNGSVEQLKGSFETMLIIIGDVFLPIVRRVVDAATSLINVFNNLPEPVQKFIAVMIGLGSAMSLFTGIAIKLAFILVPMLARFLGLMAIRQVFSIFTVGFSALRAGTGIMGALTLAFGRAGVVFTRFARIGSFLFSILVKFPRILAVLRVAATLAFGPWGIALAAVVAGVILAYNKFKPFHDLVDRLATLIRGVFLSALNAVTAAWTQFVNAFKTGQTEDEGTKLERLALILRAVVPLLVDLGRAFMENVVPALKLAGGTILQSLKSAWESLSVTFREQIMPALRELGASLQDLMPQLQELWVQLQPVLKVLGIIALVITAVLIAAIYLLAKVFLTVLLPAAIIIITRGFQVLINVCQFLIEILIIVVGTAIKFASGLVGAIQGAVQGVSKMISGLVQVVKGVFNTIAGLVTGDWTRAWNGAKQVVTGFKNIIVGLLKSMSSIVLGVIKGLVSGIVNFFKGLYNTLVGHSIVPDLVNAIIRYIATLPGRAAGALASFGAQVLSRIRSGMTSMLNGIKTGINSAVSLMRSLPGKMRSALGNLGGILLNAGRQIMNGLAQGIRNGIGQVQGILNSVTNMIPDWKGPMSTDKKLLTKNGIAIMQSLLKAFEAQMPKIEAFLAGLTQLIASEVKPPTNIIDIGREDAINAGIGSKPRTPASRLKTAIINKGAPKAKASALAKAVSNASTTNITNNIYNPVAEKSSLTLVREATRRASLGVIG